MQIFFNRSRRIRSKRKDEFDRIIDVIEKFAPVKYRRERESFYYNYRSISGYRKPLISLLDFLSRQNEEDLRKSLFANEVFEKLKNFYDPKGQISLEEAKNDWNLKKKFGDLFQFFFDSKPP